MSTAREPLTTLTRAELEALYATLPAGDWPVGPYDGYAWHHRWRIVKLFNLIWQGKDFAGDGVRNRILGRLLVQGHVSAFSKVYLINYGHGLVDELRQVRPGLYLCKFFIHGRFILYFTLTQSGVTDV